VKNETLFADDDGLPMNEVLPYAEDKYDLLRNYCQIFSTSMKNKWSGKRYYLDLYSGPGLSRIRDTNKVLFGSPLIALAVDSPFDRYIFCDEDASRMQALRDRVSQKYPASDVCFVHGNCNENLPEIKRQIPANSLGLCFVDPYDLSLRFDTLRSLSGIARLDFLCLLALQMDARRAMTYYTGPNQKLDLFLGTNAWRPHWDQVQASGGDVVRFLAEEFAARMETLGYRPTPITTMQVVRHAGRALYYLAMFSNSDRAYDLWDKSRKSATPQRGFDWKD
jgi:three-Cys-motif partner protein